MTSTNDEVKINRWQSYSFTTQVFPTLAALLQHPHGRAFFYRYLSSTKFFNDFPERKEQELHQSRFHFWLDVETYATTPDLSEKERIAFTERLMRKYESVPEVSEHAISLTGAAGGHRSLADVELKVPLAQIFDHVRHTIYDRLAAAVFPCFLLSPTAADMMGELLAPVQDEAVVKKKKSFFNFKRRRTRAASSLKVNDRGSASGRRSRSPSPLPPSAGGGETQLIAAKHIYATPDASVESIQSQFVSVMTETGQTKVKSPAPPPLAAPVLPARPSGNIAAPVRLFPSLRAILASRTATRYFQSFLVHASPQKAVKLVFLQRVSQFRQDEEQIGQLTATPSPQDIVESAPLIHDSRTPDVLSQAARSLYEKFFGENANKDDLIPLTWNVLSPIMQAFEGKNLAPTVFDGAYDEVYTSLNNIEYKEFIKSPQADQLFGELTDTLDESREAVASMARTFESFADVLQSPLAVRFFRDFLAKEVSDASEWDQFSQPLLDATKKPKAHAPALNNLDFVIAVQSFSRAYPGPVVDDKKREKWSEAAQKIHDTYISRRAVSAISLSFYRRSAITTALEAPPDGSIFNHAAEEVSQSLAHSDYPRFVNSAQAKDLCSRLKVQSRVARLKTMFPTPAHILKERSLPAQYFHRYLTSEYCAENFDFYMAVEEFRRAPRSTSLATASMYDKAVKLRDRFLNPGADEEINIAASVIRACMKDIDTLDPVPETVFDKCQQSVYELLAPNVDRFLRSDLAAQLLRHLDRFSVSSSFKIANINGPQVAKSVPLRTIVAGLKANPNQIAPPPVTAAPSDLPPPPVSQGASTTSTAPAPATVSGAVRSGSPMTTVEDVRAQINDFFSQGSGGASSTSTTSTTAATVTTPTSATGDSKPAASTPTPTQPAVVVTPPASTDTASLPPPPAAAEESTPPATDDLPPPPPPAVEDDVPVRAPRPVALAAESESLPRATSDPVCPGCDGVVDPSDSNTMSALDKLWHKGCFKCGHCDIVLGGDSFLVRGGVAYCFDDFHALFTSECYGCGESLNGMHITAMYHRWHADCFVCATCQAPFKNLAFYAQDGRPYCQDHCPSGDVICGGCDKPIEGESVSAMDQQWHGDCFACDICRDPLASSGYFEHKGKPFCEEHYPGHGDSCYKCHGRITDIKTTALDQTWHADCFVCNKCGETFKDGLFVAVEGMPYCPNHSPDALLCLGCEQAINGSYLDALGGSWHDACFVCTTCKAPFTEGYFTDENNRPFCPSHNPQIPSCQGCKEAITTSFYPVDDYKYHKECLVCVECKTDLLNSGYKMVEGNMYCGQHIPTTA